MTLEDFLAAWPNCASPDCGYKVCDWAHPTLCYRCAEQILGTAEMERRYEVSHNHDPRCACETDECLCAAAVSRDGVVCVLCAMGDHSYIIDPERGWAP